ncbi:hypothetical protein BDA96_10G143600 [Sorghum bicolor]|uniref:Uncharacterized protein n=1 Tax=Sorghum bicolor TaxID=4558 RepID=A0A921Q460_SORBI|nr:hypothetical protein BDA96_10G143600 [Sorghum bicolor]
MGHELPLARRHTCSHGCWVHHIDVFLGGIYALGAAVGGCGQARARGTGTGTEQKRLEETVRRKKQLVNNYNNPTSKIEMDGWNCWFLQAP